MTLFQNHIPPSREDRAPQNYVEEYFLEATRFVNLPQTVQLTSRYAKGFLGCYAVGKFTHTERTQIAIKRGLTKSMRLAIPHPTLCTLVGLVTSRDPTTEVT